MASQHLLFFSNFFSYFHILNFYYLQRLASDKLGPAKNLGGDALGAGKLLAHALSKEDGGLEIC